MLLVAKCVAYVEGNRTDYHLRLNQSDFNVWHESIINHIVSTITLKLLVSESKTYAFTTSEDWVGLGKTFAADPCCFRHFFMKRMLNPTNIWVCQTRLKITEPDWNRNELYLEFNVIRSAVSCIKNLFFGINSNDSVIINH